MGTHEWIGLTVYDASHRSDVEDKLYKNILAPYLETPKDIATKSGETHVWDKAPLSRKCSRRSTPGICTGQKCIFFLIGDSPKWLPSHAIHFWKALVEPMLRCDLPFSRYMYSRSNFWILGPLGVRRPTREGQTLCPGPIPSCKISRRSVSCSVAEISVTDTKI